MKEQRKEERLKEYNEITTTVISCGNNLSKEKIIYNYSEDLSVSGAKIRGNIDLPINTLLQIDLTLKNLQQKITALGKVKWIKNIIEGKYYEAGVEFVDSPGEMINKLEDYISRKQKLISLNLFGMPFSSYEN
jgi:hypothetical protein